MHTTRLTLISMGLVAAGCSPAASPATPTSPEATGPTTTNSAPTSPEPTSPEPTSPTATPPAGNTIKLAMFSDEECTDPKLQDGKPFVVEMDVSQSCFRFFYIAPSGDKVDTSHSDFKCYEDRITFDKYPFSADCTDSERIAHREDYPVGTTCQFAPSHDGGLYEMLVDYVYPGSEDCAVAGPSAGDEAQ